MRLRSHLHAGSSSAARLGPPAAVSRQLLRIQTNRSVNASFDTSSFAREAFLHRSCSHVCAAAVSSNDKPTQPEDYQQVSGLRLAQLLKIRLPSYCSGCGVKLQQEDPDGPGYYQVPRRLLDLAEEQLQLSGAAGSADDLAGAAEQAVGISAEEQQRRSIDRAMEAWLDEQQRPAVREVDAAALGEDEEGVSLKCARCYSLVHYGKVKSQTAEGLLPEFDLGKKVGRKIALQKDRQAMVLCVVDVWDFDGSLPRTALASLFPPGAAQPSNAPLSQLDGSSSRPGAPPADALPFQLAVAVNKFDLLPSQATPKRVEQWVRARLRQAGLPRPSRVFMVSALNGLGVKDMVRSLKDDMGFRADLWVVGAQNAGKSSLINAMKRLAGTGGRGEPTVAPVPGTTLGLLRVPGIPLGPKHRTFDTPGVHHPYQLTTRLSLQEAAAVLPRRRLKPRTYRIPAGSCILIGGLARLDVLSAPSATIYVTIYVSDEIVTHLGKIEGAEERRQKHTGGLLVPPYEAERLQELQLVPRTAVVEGDSWQEHSRDIAIAGLGWISVGCEGTTELQVWVPQGVMVTMHDALIPDYAKAFQKPGFSNMLPASSIAAKQRAAAFSGSKATVDAIELEEEGEEGEEGGEDEPAAAAAVAAGSSKAKAAADGAAGESRSRGSREGSSSSSSRGASSSRGGSSRSSSRGRGGSSRSGGSRRGSGRGGSGREGSVDRKSGAPSRDRGSGR
uniref:Uncharacterized protein n=1 Tax=Tetradesmus obliquus TaxID=3088 RepID=A0A383WDX7_TETOB|eukprot:jgi/Sobl393_1/5332/SZX75641.1